MKTHRPLARMLVAPEGTERSKGFSRTDPIDPDSPRLAAVSRRYREAVRRADALAREGALTREDELEVERARSELARAVAALPGEPGLVIR